MARIIQTADLDPRTKLSKVDNDWIYNGLDCAVTLEVADELARQMDDTSRRTYNFSQALQAPVLEMTIRGIKVDKHQRAINLQDTKQQIARIAEHADRLVMDGIGWTPVVGKYAKTGWWGSTKLLIELFYGVLGCKVIRKRNANGQFVPTVNRDALERLVTNFYAEPIIKHILMLRDLDKQRQSLEKDLDPDEHWRSNWNIAGTNTGRFASSESDFGTGDNSQNINRKLRTQYIADDGMKIANLDLEQADARNVGAICWNLFLDKYGAKFAGAYLDACESGDLHTQVCGLVWPQIENRQDADRIFYREFSYRDCAKRTGHGSNYLGLVNVSRATGISMSVLSDFQKKYFGAFPCIELWHDWVRAQIKEYGYITTLLGRRRYFFGRPRDENVIREAVAFEPQSLTADQINQGLLNLWRSNVVQVLSQVHDSVLFQYPAEMEDEIIPWAIEQLTINMTLAQGRPYNVPVEAKVGWNWGDRMEDRKTGKITNPSGLMKYSGHDDRSAPRYKRKRLSFFATLMEQ